MEFSIPSLIMKKRDGISLTDKEIRFFVESLSNGKSDASQIGAMLMAMYKCDLTSEETFTLVTSMVDSGVSLNWPGIVVDKHSTGGVGDKVSLPLVPSLAALGLTIPMISGRGLEWTGGTLDKLESIPGFCVNLSQTDMENCIKQSSCFIAATTKDLCPADKILYKIRDITATVDNIALITGSILSKKIAAGIKNLVLDIKVGSAAFMKSVEHAEKLANNMVTIAKKLGTNARAVLSKMDSPIGKTIGNSLEIEETLDTLMQKGPKDLLELVICLGGELMEMCGKADSVEQGKKRIEQVIADGSALTCFLNMLSSQGVSQEVVKKLGQGDYSVLPQAKSKTLINSKTTAYISSIDGVSLAKAVWRLGAGRNVPEDLIDYSVGIRLHKVVGDYVEEGETLMTIYHNKEQYLKSFDDLLLSYSFSKDKINNDSIIIKTIS